MLIRHKIKTLQVDKPINEDNFAISTGYFMVTTTEYLFTDYFYCSKWVNEAHKDINQLLKLKITHRLTHRDLISTCSSQRNDSELPKIIGSYAFSVTYTHVNRTGELTQLWVTPKLHNKSLKNRAFAPDSTWRRAKLCWLTRLRQVRGGGFTPERQTLTCINRMRTRIGTGLLVCIAKWCFFPKVCCAECYEW